MGKLRRAVLEQDRLPIQPGTLLRNKVRGVSRKCARQAKDLVLYVPGFIAFGAGPVPRALIRHRYKQLIDLALHLPGLIGLSARIRRAGFGCAARSQPLVLFKYLGDYLANSFSTAARLRIMSHHYRTLVARLPKLSKLGCPRHELVLWSHRVESDTFTILLRMETNHYYALEGDLSLDFLLNGICLHRLSFTCIPGKEVGLEGETALLVGGSQGVRGNAALIRHASKAIGEISPAVMLTLGLQALSKRLGADAILGITSAERTPPDEAKAKYDAFWEAIGGERHGRFYQLPTSVSWKDNSHLSNAHRARARRKRELKERLLAQMRENAERFLLAAASVVADNVILAV